MERMSGERLNELVNRGLSSSLTGADAWELLLALVQERMAIAEAITILMPQELIPPSELVDADQELF